MFLEIAEKAVGFIFEDPLAARVVAGLSILMFALVNLKRGYDRITGNCETVEQSQLSSVLLNLTSSPNGWKKAGDNTIFFNRIPLASNKLPVVPPPINVNGEWIQHPYENYPPGYYPQEKKSKETEIVIVSRNRFLRSNTGTITWGGKDITNKVTPRVRSKILNRAGSINKVLAKQAVSAEINGMLAGN